MTQTQVPAVERGYAHRGGDEWWNQIVDEMVRELRWPYNIPIYRRMTTDAQVISVLQAVEAPILRTGWGIGETKGVDNEVVTHVARNLGLKIRDDNEREGNPAERTRDRFSWNQHLFEAMTFLPIGHSVGEQVYRPPDVDNPRWTLRKLGHRPAESIAKWNVADDGGLDSIEQKRRGFSGIVRVTDTGDITLPINRLVVYSHRRVGANWRGVSVLRACYKNWLLKDDGNRSWAIGVQRNSMGLPVHTAGGETPEEVAEGLKIASKARAGDNSGISLAKGAEFKLQGVEGLLIDPEKFVRYHDEQIARAVLAHFLNLGTQTGSWALGATFADFFTLSLQAIAEEVRDIATKHIVEDLVDIAFGPTVPAPQIVFDEIGSRNNGVDVSDALAQLRKDAGLEDDAAMADFITRHAGSDAA